MRMKKAKKRTKRAACSFWVYDYFSPRAATPYKFKTKAAAIRKARALSRAEYATGKYISKRMLTLTVSKVCPGAKKWPLVFECFGTKCKAK